MRQKCKLVLSDGSSFQGDLIGAPLRASGELVFTTGMVGYSEAITDPSYFGQILCFTYPLIGNYGIPDLPKGLGLQLPFPSGFESARANAAAVILTIDSPEVFHWNSFQSIDEWLKNQGVPCVVGLDTRHLVHLIRSQPNLLGRIEPEHAEGYRDMGALTPKSPNAFFDPGMNNIMTEVSVKERVRLGKGNTRVGLVDCGVKWNIIRQFINFGCEVELLPWDTDLSTVDCDMWLLSNGPGDRREPVTLRSTWKNFSTRIGLSLVSASAIRSFLSRPVPSPVACLMVTAVITSLFMNAAQGAVTSPAKTTAMSWKMRRCPANGKRGSGM